MEQNSEADICIHKKAKAIKETDIYNVYDQTHTHTQNTINKMNELSIGRKY